MRNLKKLFTANNINFVTELLTESPWFWGV
jgi:hypothetical protein